MTEELRSIRVVMIIQAFLPRIGGAERQLAAQAPLLRSHNVEIHIITRRYPGMKEFEMINGIPVHRMPAIGPRPLAALSFIGSALWKIFQIKPNLIHAHELLSPVTTAIFIKWCKGTPVLAKVLRGGHLGDISKISAGLLGWLRVAFVRSSVDMYAVISREIDQELAAIGIPDDHRIFLPNGVDLDRFSPVSNSAHQSKIRNELGLPEGQLVIYSGRLEPEKNVDQLVKVWRRIRKKYGNANLVVLGTGSEELRLRELAGIGVSILGAVDDVVPYLRAANLFVLPSSTEGLSNSLLEAMSCGLPVIATKVGAASEMIEHQNSGWLIRPNSQEDLEIAITALLEDESLCKEMGKRAREYVVKVHALPVLVKSLRELYDKMLFK